MSTVDEAALFAKTLANLIHARIGDFTLQDKDGDFNKVAVSNVIAMGQFMTITLDNGDQYTIVVKKVKS